MNWDLIWKPLERFFRSAQIRSVQKGFTYTIRKC